MNLFAFFSRHGTSSDAGYANRVNSYHERASFYIPDSRISVAQSGGSFWFLSLIVGVAFVLLAVLLIIYPELLAFFFAGVMMFAGLFFISTALFLRSVRSRINQ